MPSQIYSSCANCRFYNTCQHKQMIAEAALPATQDLAAPVLRKENFAKELSEELYKSTFMYGA